ncbi:hypothetical protein EW145_g2195 [Phellinidium pouzarii]|uniref:GPI inositol-deacylase n=1 Tax=Phellinidium pouzarii TaxID=167371 RepID=A0A4S4LDQ0_9AGAM|nr:hypothetical protein EW145_g2195 [Phellinidium pouzarii]
MTSDSRPRTPLSSRLQSLLTDSPRSSLDADSADNDSMHSASLTQPKGIPARIQTASAPDLAQTVSLLPIVRWFRGESAPSSPSSPPSALREALEDDISCLSPLSLDAPPPNFQLQLQRPPPARLPAHYMNGPGRSALYRSPPFLECLARSALPTASVTRPLPVHRQTACHSSTPNNVDVDSTSAVDSASIDITQSPPTRTSLDSLRRLRDRSMPGVSRVQSTSHTRSFSTSSSPTRWWFGTRKADVDELLDESDQAETIEGEEEQIRKKYRAPKNPIVFCHGLLGFDSVQIGPAIAPMNVSHWRGIKEVLEARGIEVLITRVPATSSPVERAKVLESKISEVYPGRAVHLIGHSMGGLDCRYLTTHLIQRKFRVLSITTIATPHRGSSFADHFIATLGKERFPSFVSLLDLLPNGGGDGSAFESLTIGAMRKFNEETPDVKSVKYFSWGAVVEPGLFDAFKWPHSVVLEKEGPNDGLVSVASSRWGTYLGTLEDVNHLDLVGWINTARYKWAEFTGREIKFKPATFYLGVADHLARYVEGQGKESSSDSPSTSKVDLKSTEQSRAGAGVSTVEGVEELGPRTPVESLTCASSPPDDELRHRMP